MLQVRGGWGARVGPRRNSPGGELEIRDATPRVLLQHRVEPTNRPRDTWKDGRWDFEPLPLPSPRLQAPAVSMPATPVILATRGPSCAIWCRPVTSVTGSSVAHYAIAMWSVCGLTVGRRHLWTTKTGSELGLCWSGGGDLNSRPLRPERSALPS